MTKSVVALPLYGYNTVFGSGASKVYVLTLPFARLTCANQLRGASHLRFSEAIISPRDFYDTIILDRIAVELDMLA